MEGLIGFPNTQPTVATLTRQQRLCLFSSLNIIIDDMASADLQPQSIKIHNYMHLSGDLYSAETSWKYSQSSTILASWTDNEGNVSLKEKIRPGIIKRLFTFQCYINSNSCITSTNIAVAEVQWYAESSHCERFGHNLEVWERRVGWSDIRPSNFIPVLRINGKFVPAYSSVDEL